MSEKKPCIHKCVCDLCDIDPEDCGYYEAEKTCHYRRVIKGYYEDWECDVCGNVENQGIKNYCPNCGAKVVDE